MYAVDVRVDVDAVDAGASAGAGVGAGVHADGMASAGIGMFELLVPAIAPPAKKSLMKW